MEGKGLQKYKILKGEVVEGTVRCSGVRQMFPCSGLGPEVAHSEVTRRTIWALLLHHMTSGLLGG